MIQTMQDSTSSFANPVAVASYAEDAPERWLALSAAFGNRADSDRTKAAAAGKTMAERLPILAPAEEEELLREAGFLDVALFYAAFSFRGWVATAGSL